MPTIKEFVKEYVPQPKTKVISELDKVSIDADIQDDEYIVTDKSTGQQKTVKQKIIKINEEIYRVPITVVQQIKVLIEDNPNLKFFKVKKTGTDLDTRYQTIPVLE